MSQHAIQNQNICNNIIVKNDSFIALRGGTLKNFGVIVIAGSGCNCAVLSPSGEEFIYQYYVEDNIQGGRAISRKMIDAIYQAETWRIENDGWRLQWATARHAAAPQIEGRARPR